MDALLHLWVVGTPCHQIGTARGGHLRGCFDASCVDTSRSDRDTGQLASRGQWDTLKTRIAAALLHSSSVGSWIIFGQVDTSDRRESGKPDGLARDKNMAGRKQVKIFKEC